MILEQAILPVKPGQGPAFEQALREALPLIQATPGFVKLEVRDCIEMPGQYLLLVWWETLENHTVDFRESPAFLEWRGIVGPFFAQPPQVEHFELLARSA